MALEQGVFSEAVRPRTELETESWRMLRAEWQADPESAADYESWETRRTRARPEIVELLRQFIEGVIGVEELRRTLDRRTRTEWDAFGLRGSSGAMFLNQLVKHTSNLDQLTGVLRRALTVPPNVASADAQLRELLTGLARNAADVEVTSTAGSRQPTRAVFFVSMCWHLQDPERWPGYHVSARQALQLEEDLFLPTGDARRDYFSFREIFLSLAHALGLSVWALEHLCWWHQRRGGRELTQSSFAYEGGSAVRRVPRTRAVLTDRPRAVMTVREPAADRERAELHAAPRDETLTLGHTHIQWLLAKIGWSLGCRVWIAASDWKRRWENESLGSLSVSKLPPLGLDAHSQRIISAIDVVWLKGTHRVAAAFEVEHTTAVYSGLLRMADLTALSPNLNFPLYIVAPRDRLEKVERELSRPTFQMLELHRRCGFFSSEALLDGATSIMRWASGPAAIERLASRVDDAVRGAEGSERIP